MLSNFRASRKKQKEAVAAEVADEDGKKGFTAESLFDYVNETVASLAKIVSAQKKTPEAVATEEPGMSRRLTVTTSILNKDGERVYFTSEVEVFPLPSGQSKDAWVTSSEWTPVKPERGKRGRKKKDKIMGTAELDAWLRKERQANLVSFKRSISQLFNRQYKDDESIDEDIDTLDVQIEMVETSVAEEAQRNERRRSGHSSASKSTAPTPQLSRTASQSSSRKLLSEMDKIYGNSPGQRLAARRFEIEAPMNVDSVAEDEFLSQNVLDKKLSRSQAAAAASAGRVLIMKSDAGVTFGAAVKRKVSLNPKHGMRPKRSAQKKRSSTRRRRHRKKEIDERTPNTGFSMRPQYIVIFYLLPLIAIGLDDLWPVVEHIWFVSTHPETKIKYDPGRPLTVPFWIYIIWPNFNNEKWLKNTYRFGSYAIEMSGMLVVLQLMYAWMNLFSVIRQRVNLQTRLDYDDYSDSSSVYSEALEPENYAYLFKWQQDPERASSNGHIAQLGAALDDDYLEEYNSDRAAAPSL